MSSCLGIYIQNNLIKYAKMSKDRNNLKVEAYGVKFYDSDIEKTIEQIVKETFSYQTPVSINVDNEKYTYSNVFNLLKPQDLEKSIDTEFEFFCNNNNKNKNTLEYRRIKAPNLEDRDKVRVIYSYVDKVNIVEKLQLFDKYTVKNISPEAIVTPNINKVVFQENCAIVNIEKETEITTMQNGEIYKVDKIDAGMGGILKSIAERENSFNKAYDICKNTTVYTKSGQNLKLEGNEYSDEIIVSLLEIIEKVRGVIEQNQVEVNSIYITGLGIVINNVDLLFQENFINKKCELLVPFFVEKTNVKINIKDYLEVNSAIALAIQGLEPRNKDINFNTKTNVLSNVMKLLTSDVKTIKKSSSRPAKKVKSIKESLGTDLDFIEKLLIRGATTIALTVMLYVGVSEVLVKQTDEKTAKVKEGIEETKKQIARVEEYSTLMKNRTTEYQRIVAAIDEANAQISENYSSKNAIPNLLNKIMYNIPTGVQLLSIENKSGKSIVITAQAKKYDQLGYFKAVLEEEGILNNITTTKGTKQDDTINITITGELPY